MKKIVRLTENDIIKIVNNVLEEQTAVGAAANALEVGGELLNILIKILPPTEIISIVYDALVGNSRGVVDAFTKHKAELGNNYQSLVNAVTKGDLSKFAANLKKQAAAGLGNQPAQRKSPPPPQRKSPVRVEPQYSYKPTYPNQGTPKNQPTNARPTNQTTNARPTNQTRGVPPPTTNTTQRRVAR